MSYLDELESIKENVDKVINSIRNNHTTVGNTQWFFKLLILPFKSVLSFKSIFKSVVSFSSSVIPTFLVGIGIPAVNHFIIKEGEPIPLSTMLTVIGVTYLFSIGISFFRMATLEDDNFHIGVYRILKKKEFEFFSNFFNKNLTYSGLYNQFRDLSLKGDIKTGEKVDKIEERISKMEEIMLHYQAENADLKEQNASRESDIEELIQEYESAIGLYEDLLDLIEESEGLSSKLLTKATNSLFRLHEDTFNTEDLRLLSDYSVYQLEGDKLKLIKNGGVPEIPGELYLDSKDVRWNAILQAAVSGSEDEIVMNMPRPTCAMVSKYVKMPNNTIWIYNFHFYESDSLYQDVLNDMTLPDIDEERKLVHIKSPEITRLIKAICYNVYKSHLPKKGVAVK